jgi:hypothetical protein
LQNFDSVKGESNATSVFIVRIENLAIGFIGCVVESDDKKGLTMKVKH